MKKQGRVFRSQWVPRDEPKAAPTPTAREQKARNLPLPGPGIVVRVPLHLWPEYQALHALKPTGIREPRVQPEKGPGEALLLVKREPKGENE